MGILYIDEAGNSGLVDLDQPNLIYGGPFLDKDNWSKLLVDFEKVKQKYRTLILTRIGSVDTPEKFESMLLDLNFFEGFHFHAKEIIKGKSLWGKLKRLERFDVLQDLVDIMKTHNVEFMVGILNKAKYLQNVVDRTSVKPNEDFTMLLPKYFEYLEQQIGDKQYVVVVADGDPQEKEILNQTLYSQTVKKCIPESFIYPAASLPMLQLADAGLWIIQAYNRLKDSDQSPRAQKIRSLYVELNKILKLYEYS